MASDTVHILMAVHNGAAHLEEQLKSFEAQTYKDWVLIASDDSSRDDSLGLLQAFSRRHGETRLLTGPCRGGAANFLHAIRQLSHMEPAPRCVAFSDQDDVWLPHKLERAVGWLARTDPETPALYCSRSLVADQNLKNPKLSAARPRAPGFRNALVQNIAAGNTIMLNAAATRLVVQSAIQVSDLVVHDWWIYQLVTGAGGTVLHDDEPGLLYRQHDANQIGANDGWKARFVRIAQLLRGDFRDWNRINIGALTATADALTPENRQILQQFAQGRDLSFLPRVAQFWRLRLYRQTAVSTFALWVAVVLGRI